MDKQLLSMLFILMVITWLAGCATPIPPDPLFASIDSKNLPIANYDAKIEGLTSCTTSPDSTIRLNSNEPVIVIAHGCYGSAALFRSLAQVFAFHGQQGVCFNYNDRDSLMKSSAELISSLNALSAKMDNPNLIVIGHSQGGLVARSALTKGRQDQLSVDNSRLQLITISAPYAGIFAANHCGSKTIRLLSLGLVVPICHAISGDKWYEITAPSPYIQQPGTLLERVSSHLKIVTDETGSCRARDENGTCIEDDFVFSVKEQYFGQVDNARGVDNVEIAAGHVEIVGDYNVVPIKLIELLQEKGVMRSTPPAKLSKLSELLAQIYHY
jgi:hypothetical protein